ncbi:MAG: MATE family efflux transporter [Pseudomonadota bacterium]
MDPAAKPPTKKSDFAVTNRGVFAIAAPMTLAFVSTPLVGLADTWAVGQLGDAALVGAIAVGGIIFDVLFTTMNFLRSGTTGLVAQAYGAGQPDRQLAVLLRALLLALVIGMVALLVQAPFFDLALAFLGGSARVQEAVGIYFSVRILAAPISLSNFVVLGFFLGRGEALTGLAIQTVLNLTNVILNVYFVLVLDLGVAGVAAASILAEAVALLLGIVLLARRLRRWAWPSPAVVFDRAELWRMFAVNRDIMIRSFALLFAFATFTRLSAQQGETTLAANAILEKYFLLASYFLDGLATAAEQIVGRAIGAGVRQQFVRAVKLCALWSGILAACATVLFLLAGDLVLTTMTTAQDVRELGSHYLVFAALTPVIGAAAVVLDGVFIGATWSRDMRNMMLVSLAVFLGLAYVLTPLAGNTGLWISLLAFLGMRGVTLGAILPRRLNATLPGPA